jgi:hypothetical protein
MTSKLLIKKLPILGIDAAQVPSIMENSQLPLHTIGCVNWTKYPYKPNVQFRIAHNGQEIFLYYLVDECDIKAICRSDNGKVWEDSCVEFFVAFPPYQTYMNIECNCIGRIHAALRTNRENIIASTINFAGRIKRWASLGNKTILNASGEWEVAMVIPVEIFGMQQIDSFDGVEARANFYKCGDKLITPHYLSWHPIDTPKPNFHVPQFFGEIEFES